MHDCERCGGALPREAVFTHPLSTDERIVYIHCEFCESIRSTLEIRDDNQWCLATTVAATRSDRPAVYAQELRLMREAMSADIPPVRGSVAPWLHPSRDAGRTPQEVAA